MKSLLGTLMKAPVPYTDQARPWYSPSSWGRGSGTAAQLGAMEASATVFSVVSRCATAVAKETWHLHRVRPGATCDECECPGVVRVEKHPALTVLATPNEFYTTQEYFESGQQHVDLTGEGWTIVSRIGTVPSELWVARPDRMVVVTSPTDFLTGYLYCTPDGREMPIRKEDVLSIRMPHPKDPYRGLGPVQSIMPQVAGGAHSSEWNANFYRNGARPGGIVKLSRRLPPREFDRLVERWNANHLGVANANRTAFLEEGDWVDVKPLSIADMQFVETANLNRDTILLAFGASKFDVGVLEDVNRAASQAAKDDFGGRMTTPRLDRWRGMLNNDYLPLFGRDGLGDNRVYSFVYSNPISRDQEQERADKSTAADVYAKLVGAGVHPDDAAQVAGLPPMRRAAAPV